MYHHDQVVENNGHEDTDYVSDHFEDAQQDIHVDNTSNEGHFLINMADRYQKMHPASMP